LRQTTAIWLAGRHRKDGHASVRRAILATPRLRGTSQQRGVRPEPS
jgi:hypothetical protein